MSTALEAHSPPRTSTNIMDEDVIDWSDPPSSPFIEHVELDQENVAPRDTASTPTKKTPLDDNNFASAIKRLSPQKGFGFKDRSSPAKPLDSPSKQLFGELEKTTPTNSPPIPERLSSKKTSPIKFSVVEEEEHVLRESSHNRTSPLKLSPSKRSSVERSESPLRRSTHDEPTILSRSSTRSSATKRMSLEHEDQPEPKLRKSSQEHQESARPSPTKRTSSERVEQTLRENEGLTIAMKILEETRSESHYETHHKENSSEARSDSHGSAEFDSFSEFSPDGPDGPSTMVDDTCFSNFSEMPDMTKFANSMMRSPAKSVLNQGMSTPRANLLMTPATARKHQSQSPSPTPRRNANPIYSDNDTTNLLLDFTQQIEAFSTATHRSPTRGRNSPTKSATESNLLSFIQNQRSPAKSSFVPSTPAEKRHLLNLLDFELPPPPTPRSIPSITIRELESLKSGFQSQVSSLTASLSGKEAEVSSLKKAVSSAERRVGEAQEQVREERSAREHAEKQKAEWEKKGTEVEAVLKSIKEEVMKSDQEREELFRKLDEAERRAEDAELRANDAESRAVEAEGKCVDTTVFVEADTDKPTKGPVYTAEEVQKQIDEKVATLCKELHVIYKKKHESKVSALKRSYEEKMARKTKELQTNVKDLKKKCEELQHARDATFSTVLPTDIPSNSSAAINAADLQKLETQQAEIEEQKARLAGLESEIQSVRDNHAQVLKELEAERVEKGELVAAAEQMLSLQMEFQAQQAAQEEMRRSVGPAGGNAVRPSGLTRPGFAGSGIGGRSTSGKSRIMSNIEKMGGRSASSE
ncbi:hypothetical protein BU16DRAFT_523604 [Lophium mytilinum]|uniref:Uncharacterized protein n=1 Tax=Lophium mytilinum TaxID=390894 RepID=A0A6A6R8X6_9PEZI|nr:hypothetical protein BU16DRAFT_523604 [Lophium mytilinum]